EDTSSFPSALPRLERFAHFCALVWKSFLRNRCPVRASALSYSTLLALIPMLAVAISVTSSLLKSQGEDSIYSFIDKVVASVMPPAVNVSTNTPTVTPSHESTKPSKNSGPVLLASTNEMLSVTSTNTMTGTNQVAGATETRVVTAQKEAAKYIHEFIQNS